MVDPRDGRARAVEDARASGGGGDRRARSAGGIVSTGAGEEEVAHEVRETRLSARAATGSAQPVVEDVVAEVVDRAGADRTADAGQAALLVSVEVVVHAQLRVAAHLKQGAERMAGIGAVGVEVRVVLALGDVRVLHGDVGRQFIGADVFVGREEGRAVVDHDPLTADVERVVDIAVGKSIGARVAEAVAGSHGQVADDRVASGDFDHPTDDGDPAGSGLPGDGGISAGGEPTLGVPAAQVDRASHVEHDGTWLHDTSHREVGIGESVGQRAGQGAIRIVVFPGQAGDVIDRAAATAGDAATGTVGARKSHLLAPGHRGRQTEGRDREAEHADERPAWESKGPREHAAVGR